MQISKMLRTVLVLLFAAAFVAVFASCDTLVGSDDNNNDNNGSSTENGGKLGEADFKVTSDTGEDQNIEDGEAFFRVSDDGGIAAYSFEISIADAFFDHEIARIRLQFSTDDEDFLPDEDEYSVTNTLTQDEWWGQMSFLEYVDRQVNEDGETRLTVTKSSSDKIEGSFEIAFDTGDGDATAKGIFSAAPYPD